MLEISNPVQLFSKQKLIKTNSHVENKPTAGIEVKKGKEVVILYRFDGGEFLAGEERAQLLKIMGACKLKEEDVVLVNTAVAKSITLTALRERFALKTLLVFGEIAVSQNFELKKYHTYQLDGLQIVKSEPIAKLIKSPADKKALWEELKGVFKID